MEKEAIFVEFDLLSMSRVERVSFVAKELRDVFSHEQDTTPQKLTIQQGEHPEDTDWAKILSGRRWQDLTRQESWDLPCCLLTPPAYCKFAPAALLVESEDDERLGVGVGRACLGWKYSSEELKRRLSYCSKNQLLSLRHYVELHHLLEADLYITTAWDNYWKSVGR